MEGEMSLAGDISVNGNECILEGSLLKRSSHHYWNERYFVFSADSILSYYHKKGAERARRSYVVSREAGCEVSNLYVSQRQVNTGKELIYCFKLSWNTVENGSKNSEKDYNRDDASSVGTGPDNAHNNQSFRRNNTTCQSPGNTLDDDIDYLFENYEETDRCTSPLMSDQGLEETQNYMSGDRSVDSDSVVIQNSSSHEVIRPAITQNASSGNLVSAQKTKKKRKSHWPKPSKAFKNMTRGTSSGAKKSSKKGDKERPVEVLFPPEEDKDVNNFNASFSHTNGDMDMSLKRTERVQRIYAEQKMKERDKLQQQYLSKKKASKKKQQKMLMQGTTVAVAASAAAGVAILTAGVGLLTGLAFVGIGAAAGASGGGASVLGLPKRGKRSEIVIATASYEDAKLWKSTLDAHLEYENLKETTWGRILFSKGQATNPFLAQQIGSADDLGDRKMNGGEKTFLFEPSTQWRPLDGWAVSLLGTGNQGLRIFREEKSSSPTQVDFNFRNRPVQRILTNLSVDGGTCSPMKAHVVLNTSPLDAFMCIMSYARMFKSNSAFCPQSEQATSFRVIESIDDHMDVVHLVFRPIYLFPSWTCPRDFVLVRYWRFEPDGSYVICYESVQHRDCPPFEGYVRGEMHQAYTVSPRKRNPRLGKQDPPQECLLTAVVQVDPKGWVPISPFPFISSKCYGDAFGIAALLQLLDIRDAIDRDRFLAVALDIEPPTNHFRPKTYDLPASETHELASIHATSSRNGGDEARNYDFSYAGGEASKSQSSSSGLTSTPPPFYLEKWAEPDANSFLVRGPSYKTDQVKINAGQSIARLFAVDFVEVDSPIYSGMTKHPRERVQLALKKEKELKAKGLTSDVPPFIFVLNIVLPGEPLYHGVFYYAVDDMSEIDGTSGTPTSKLCNKFFFGDSDEFRDRTFKLIPQIVQGNFMVRKAVGSTPAIMGKKLRQLYVKDEEESRFFEIVLDCCSSSVAAGVIRLSLGYAKTIVVDLGYLFEGDDAEVLPERILGCVRIKNPDFSMPIRKQTPP